MPPNTAAWQLTPGTSIEIKPAPYTSPAADEIVTKNHALAINPIDAKLQDEAYFPFIKYPCILGLDVAGQVVEVGSDASSRFKLGDRVVALATGMTQNQLAGAGFQEHTVVLARVASHIPASLSYADASVLPLAVSTAACGLFQKDQLGLQHPSLSSKQTGQTLLVWGGASSVGCCAIQLAVAAGYEVIATASSKNFNLVKQWGATEVFDYTIDAHQLTEQLVQAFKGKTIAGAYQAAGSNSDAAICAEVLINSTGNKFLTTAIILSEQLPKDVKSNRIFGSTLKDNEVGPAVWVDFLGQALEQGKFVAAPEAEVVGNGLEAVQKGLDVLRKGVSAKKVVVTLN